MHSEGSVILRFFLCVIWFSRRYCKRTKNASTVMTHVWRCLIGFLRIVASVAVHLKRKRRYQHRPTSSQDRTIIRIAFSCFRDDPCHHEVRVFFSDP
uniref:Uncharacterized protein n=1 Tax=Ixodes ricinus TaxID=34613 RepID=A0A6B0U4H5_IXORI